jgi:hypothetical protein
VSPADPTLNQFDPVHTYERYFLKISSNVLFSHLHKYPYDEIGSILPITEKPTYVALSSERGVSHLISFTYLLKNEIN